MNTRTHNSPNHVDKKQEGILSREYSSLSTPEEKRIFFEVLLSLKATQQDAYLDELANNGMDFSLMSSNLVKYADEAGLAKEEYANAEEMLDLLNMKQTLDSFDEELDKETFLSQSDEVILHIISYLQLDHLIKLSQTNKRIHHLVYKANVLFEDEKMTYENFIKIFLQQTKIPKSIRHLFNDSLFCKIIKEPVITYQGTTYEKTCIAKHIKNQAVDPFSRGLLKEEFLLPNHNFQAVKAYFTTAEHIDISVVPDCFKCPLTGLIFIDAVVGDDGHTYEKDALHKWLDKHNEMLPKMKEQNQWVAGDIKQGGAFYPNRWLNDLIDEVYGVEQRYAHFLHGYAKTREEKSTPEKSRWFWSNKYDRKTKIDTAVNLVSALEKKNPFSFFGQPKGQLEKQTKVLTRGTLSIGGKPALEELRRYKTR